MPRTTAELTAELEEMRQALLIVLDNPNALQYIDLLYIAQQIKDIKQELRIARTRE